MNHCELKKASGKTLAIIILSAALGLMAGVVALLAFKLFGRSDDYDFDDFDIDDDEDYPDDDNNEFFAEDKDFEK